jgi:hypothetical protein
MTVPDVDPREFDRLLAALCDAELAPSEMARLNQLLRSAPEWRDRYILYMGIHATLHNTMGGGRAAGVGDEGEAGRSPRIRLKLRGERRRWAAIGRLRRVGLAASAMVLLAAMGAIAGRWWMGRRAVPDASTGGPIVARASRGAGVRFGAAGLSAGPDQSMRAGEYRLIEGIVQVTFRRGAEVLIMAPAEFALSEDRLLLRSGKLTARVPEPAKGFTVETPSATLIDLGTEFAAEVDQAANGEVHVFRGEVIVQPRSQTDVRPVRLTGARATRIDVASATPSGIDVDATRFLRQFEEPATEYSRLAAAMNPQIYLGMEPTLDGHSLSDVGSSRAIGRVVPGPGHGTSWFPGRFGSSLRLRGPGHGDYALIPFRREMVGETMSVVAWVLAESRPRWASILKRWGRPEDHCFHFGLYLDDGDLEIHTAQADGREFTAREGRPLPTGRWQHVAFVADRKVLRLYRNGVEVARADHPGLRPGTLESIGVGAKLNVAGDGPDPIEPGFWDGRLDEIAIYPQALDADQVRRLYLAAADEGSRDPGGEGVASPGAPSTPPRGRPSRDPPLITSMSPPGRAGPVAAATPMPPESRALLPLPSNHRDEVSHEGP